MTHDYKWYCQYNGVELEQGDIFLNYPVFLPAPYEFPDDAQHGDLPEIDGEIMLSDVIVVTQSCDLANRKVDTVILCPIHSLEDIEASLGSSPKEIKKRKEDIRQGKEPGFHMIAEDEEIGLSISVVEFKRIYTTPKKTLEDYAGKMVNRIRILPPYKEHLAQAFARYFMRVGLPEDIPSFK